MTDAEFERYYARYTDVIQGIARKYAKTDDDLFDDLCQVGRITLWHLEPKKARSNIDAWIRKALRNKIAGFIRRWRPHRTESLDAMLDAGDQVAETPTGPKVLPYSDRFRDNPRSPSHTYDDSETR